MIPCYNYQVCYTVYCLKIADTSQRLLHQLLACIQLGTLFKAVNYLG